MSKEPDFKKHIIAPLRYDEHGQLIVDGNGNMFLNVRGWGRLQKLENGMQIQDSIGEWITDTLNKELEKDGK